MKKLFIKILKAILNLDFLSSDNFINYISNGDALPRTLTEEEERDLILKLDTSNEEAKQQLIEHNLRLVVYIAKKFENVNVDLEDLISIGALGLIKAINSFNSTKNIKIATYASKCIENEILMYLRKISKRKTEVSLDEPLFVDAENNELVLFDLISSEENEPEDDMNRSLEKQILWQVLDSLNKREKEIMILRFGLNNDIEKTQKEVADDLKISQSYISRLEKRTVRRIKKEMLKYA